jgi:hypothetical protein
MKMRFLLILFAGLASTVVAAPTLHTENYHRPLSATPNTDTQTLSNHITHSFGPIEVSPWDKSSMKDRPEIQLRALSTVDSFSRDRPPISVIAGLLAFFGVNKANAMSVLKQSIAALKSGLSPEELLAQLSQSQINLGAPPSVPIPALAATAAAATPVLPAVTYPPAVPIPPPPTDLANRTVRMVA